MGFEILLSKSKELAAVSQDSPDAQRLHVWIFFY